MNFPNVDPTGQADAAPMINAALASGVAVLPSGTFALLTTINVPANTSLIMPGSGACTFNVVGNNPAIKGMGNNVTISGGTFRRTGGSADGLQCLQASQDVNLSDLIMDGHNNGFSLGPSYYGMVDKCQALNCTGDGFSLFNTSTSMVLQWNLMNTLAEWCKGYGYRVTSYATYGTCGMWSNTTTFQNTAGGCLFAATPGNTLNDVRLQNVNISTDIGHGLSFNTSGEHNQIIGGLVESSVKGSGVVIFGNNPEVILSGLAIRGHYSDGIGTAGLNARLSVNACMVSANNQGNVGANGITIGPNNTSVTLTGVQSYGAPQTFSLWSNSKPSVAGCAFDRTGGF
jgi:hypothetical protein